jgi:hypothetical protein
MMTWSLHVCVVNRISGTTAVELLSALHWYLKYWCGAHISWSRTGGAQLASVPKSGSLPRVQEAGILVKRPTPWSYYQNAVTSSCEDPISYLLFLFILFTCFGTYFPQPVNFVNFLSLYFWKIRLHGGTGKDGRTK